MASYNDGKAEIVSWICKHVSTGGRILDVGACDGKWAALIGAQRSDVILQRYENFSGNKAERIE